MGKKSCKKNSNRRTFTVWKHQQSHANKEARLGQLAGICFNACFKNAQEIALRLPEDVQAKANDVLATKGQLAFIDYINSNYR